MTHYELPKGKVLILRTCKPHMTSYRGFTWPRSGPVSAPDFDPSAKCGGGLHGWLWGAGNFGMRYKEMDAVWLVVEVDEDKVIDLDGTLVKFPSGCVIFCGDFLASYELVIKWFLLRQLNTNYFPDAEAWHIAVTSDCANASTISDYTNAAAIGFSGHAYATGDSGHAMSAGRSGRALAGGQWGHALSSGNDGYASAVGEGGNAISAGDYSQSFSEGEYGHAISAGAEGYASAAGMHGHAVTVSRYGRASASGCYGHAIVVGYRGKARCGEDGAIILTYEDEGRRRYVIGYAGENGIEAGKWYKLDAKNKFVETTDTASIY